MAFDDQVAASVADEQAEAPDVATVADEFDVAPETDEVSGDVEEPDEDELVWDFELEPERRSWWQRLRAWFWPTDEPEIDEPDVADVETRLDELEESVAALARWVALLDASLTCSVGYANVNGTPTTEMAGVSRDAFIAEMVRANTGGIST